MMLLAGCAVGPDYQQPAPPAVTHWNDKGDSGVKSQTTSAATNPRWWKPSVRRSSTAWLNVRSPET
ncbi:RND transporter [Enterobacter asburiae]|nr:RND transporter [Enterobacter asburiae]